MLRHTDPRTRLVAALVLLVGISVNREPPGFACIAVAIAAGLLVSHVRLRPLLVRTLAIMTLPGVFVLLTYLMGDSQRAVLLLTRSSLSAGVLIVLTGVTPLPELSRALTGIGAPALLTETIQLVYRYLFVMTDQAMRMRDAVSCRGGSGSLLAAGGTVGVLFARSYARAEGVHRAMLSRGYTGSLPESAARRTGRADLILIVFCCIAAFGGALIRAFA